MNPRVVIWSVVVAALTVPLHGQVFKSTSELVTVPVVVTNRSGDDRLQRLTRDIFRIFEDGVEQQITVFDQERRPVSLCIVLDASTSMAGQRQTLARLMVQSVFDRLLPDDEVAVVVFAPIVSVPIPWVKARDRTTIDWGSYQLVDGGTVLNDALRTALGLLDKASNPTTAILMVSDGEESTSQTKLSQLVATRRQREALVYAVQPIAPVMSGTGRTGTSGGGLGAGGTSFQAFTFNVLPSLVGDSGGVVYKVFADDTVDAAASKLFDDLRDLYTIGYAPAKPADGKYRRVKVELRNKNVRVRHRAGYLALPQ